MNRSLSRAWSSLAAPVRGARRQRLLRGLVPVLVGVALLAVPSSVCAVEFFVAPGGNDGWSGRLPEPNAEGSDGPFASVQRAQRAVRETLADSDAAEEVVVTLRGGTYFLDQALTFTPQDSGTENAPVVYRAYEGERPVISGGTRLSGWEVDDAGRWHLTIDKVASGDWNFAQLFVDGGRRYRPRLPKTGYYTIAEQLPPSGKAPGSGHDRFGFAQGDLRTDWYRLEDVEVIGFHQWSASRLRIDEIDADENTVEFVRGSRSESQWGAFPKGHRYFVVNVKEALEEPGEFYLDRGTGELTYIPRDGEDPTGTEVIAPRLDNLLVFSGEGDSGRWVQHLRFEGLTLAHTNWTCPPTGQAFPQAEVGLDAAVVGIAARDVTLDTCAVVHTGAYAVAWGAGCRRCVLTGCELVDLGGGGVKIGHAGPGTWADARTIPQGDEALASHITVENCTIAHGGRLHPAAVGVWIGHSPHNTIVHNDIFDLYYTGVSVGWTWGYSDSPAHHNQVDHNHIYQIGQHVLSDMGGVYTLGISPGTTVNNNVIHDVYAFSYGGWGLYTDEGSTHIAMENNLVYRTKTGSFHQHYGKENSIRNNILVNSQNWQVQRTRTEDHISFFFERNVVYWENDSPLLGSNWRDNNFQLDYNVYWNDGKPIEFPGGLTLEEWRDEREQDQHSLIADPQFVDAENDDYRLEPDSPAFDLGFEAFDPSAAGRSSPRVLTADLPPVGPSLHTARE